MIGKKDMAECKTALTATTFGLADAIFVTKARTSEARHGKVQMANARDG
jgi:hypothetical protein